MKKFVRFQRNSNPGIGLTIPIDDIVGIRGAAAPNFSNVEILTSVVTNPGATPELLTYTVVLGNSPVMNLGDQNEAVLDITNKITDSYTKSWTNPLLVIEEAFDGNINRTVGNIALGSVAV